MHGLCNTWPHIHRSKQVDTFTRDVPGSKPDRNTKHSGDTRQFCVIHGMFQKGWVNRMPCAEGVRTTKEFPMNVGRQSDCFWGNDEQTCLLITSLKWRHNGRYSNTWKTILNYLQKFIGHGYAVFLTSPRTNKCIGFRSADPWLPHIWSTK
jgi:hypothetical protein